MEVREISLADIPSFQETLDEVASERKYLQSLSAPSLAEIEKFVRNNLDRGYPHYVAVLNGKVIGWADFIPVEKQALCHTAHLGMGVIKSHRGVGIGDALLYAVTAAAKARGFKRLELEVFANNVAAIALYNKHGFELEGTKRNARCIDGRFIDAHIMAILVD